MDVAYNFYVAVQELTEHRRLFNAQLHETLKNQKNNNSTQTREQRDIVLSLLSRFSALAKKDRKEFPPRVYQYAKKYMVAELSAFHPCCRTNCPCPPWLSLDSIVFHLSRSTDVSSHVPLTSPLTFH
jgi:hypothetical protein